MVVSAVLDTGSEKAAAHRLGLSHSTVKHRLASARSEVGPTTTAQLVWMLASRLPEPAEPEPIWPAAEPTGRTDRPSSVATVSASAYRKG